MKTKIAPDVLKVVTMLFVGNLAAGLFYFSTSSLSPLIAADLSFTDSQLAILFSLPSFGYAVLGDLPGRFADRISAKNAMILSYGLICLSAFGKLFANSFPAFLFLTLLLTLGMVLSMPSSRTIIKELNVPQFEKLVVITNLGMTIGNWLSHTFSIMLAARTGSWRGSYAIFFGAMLMLGALGTALMLSGLKRHSNAQPGSSRADSAETLDETQEKNEKTVKILLMVMLFGVYGQSFALNSWLPKMLVARGFETGISSLAASLYSFGTLAVSITISFIVPSLLKKKRIGIWAAAAAIPGLFFLAKTGVPAGVAAAALFVGLSIGLQDFYTHCLIVLHSPKKKTGRFVSAIYCAGNIGSLVSINAIGKIPGDRMLPKVVCIAAFSLLFIAGGVLLFMQKNKAAVKSLQKK